jgi:hypothetical protein
VLWEEHLVREDPAGLAETSGVERLESFVDEVADVVTPARPVIADRSAAQVIGFGMLWGAWSTALDFSLGPS